MFTSCTYPSEWKSFLVCFIPKSSSDKMRPISLASCTHKILERLLCNRLNWWVEYHKVIRDSQFGFRRKRACSDNIAILYTNIIKAFKSRKSVTALFLDIQAAYDNVLPNILINKLMKLGIPPKSLCFINHIVASRQLFCRYGDVDEVL